MALTGIDFYRRYGHPNSYRKWMLVWDVPEEIEIGFIPKKIYCHRDLIKPLEQAFRNLIERGYVNELISWDGCWNFRAIRGYEKKYANLMKAGKEMEALKLLSIHSWGLAIDVNASQNGLGAVPKLTAGFVKCFTDAGFTWGGTFKRKDGMHFQLAALPVAA
jgi:hypothetical protein